MISASALRIQSDQVARRLRNLAITVRKPPRPVHGFRSGDLDEGSLHNGTVCDRVFSRPPREGRGPVLVSLVIDLSGSMNGHRLNTAKVAAMALHKAMVCQRVKVQIWGHNATTRGEVQLWEIDPEWLHLVGADHYNADGIAIREIAKRMRNGAYSRRLMILISDGRPNVDSQYGRKGYSGDAALTDVRNAVRSLPGMGIDFAAIVLDHGVDSLDGEYMFKRFIPVNSREDLDLVNALSANIRKFLV